MAKKAEGNGWDRAEVNLRLTKRRKDLLRAMLAGLPATATPTDAIDMALAATGEKGRAIAERLDDFEDAMDRHAMERRFETDRVEEAISKLAARLESLHQLISAVAQGSED
jgi:hypothetical protein